MNGLFSRSAVFVFAIITIGFQSTAARADAVKCKAAIVKGAAAFIQTKANALAKCEEAIVEGKVLAGDCHADPKTAATIAKAVTKLESGIAKACGDKDKICGAGGDDDALANIGWDIGVCPNFTNGGCNGAIAYGALIPSDPKTQKEINRGQVAISKAAKGFLVAKSIDGLHDDRGAQCGSCTGTS